MGDVPEKKELYRKRKAAFRSNRQALDELTAWKEKDDSVDYVTLSGLIPAALVGQTVGSIQFKRSDTFFSEFKDHNEAHLILSESEHSYIIGNLASYDGRQYLEYHDGSFRPGKHAPEGQGFGHCLVIPKERIFNVVDPAATAYHCDVLMELKNHFEDFWKHDGKVKILESARLVFEEQNRKLTTNEQTSAVFRPLLPTLEKDFEASKGLFLNLSPKHGDFEYGFHAWPDNSVGHLHMHVFPKMASLREFSTKAHDWKTIPLEAVLGVEREDANHV